MPSSFQKFLAGLTLLVTGLAGYSNVAAEPLRILVPLFDGDQAVSKVVSMTVYFEMLKAFRNPSEAERSTLSLYGEAEFGKSGAERGAWVLYGEEEFNNSSHKAAISAAAWPSVSADIVVWGNATRFGDGIVIEPHVTRTPISEKREVQPEILHAKFRTSGREYDLSLANSAAFFDLEPFTLTSTFIDQSADYSKGIPIYKSTNALNPREYISDVVYFLKVTDSAALVRYDDTKQGWIKFPKLPQEDLSMIYFGRGLIQILRGDWQRAIVSFTELNKFSSLPNSLRIDSNIYLGIALYKLEQSGLQQFRRAASLNEFDREAASFYLLGLLLDYRQKRDPGLLNELEVSIEKFQVLFSSNDHWFSNLRQLAADYLQ